MMRRFYNDPDENRHPTAESETRQL
ncbi:hypothetical protein HKBW3S42_00962, partial [Candidatus Hakubella thermalkaliphila]